MKDQPSLGLDEPQQPLGDTWVRPKGAGKCGRDPAAGPGTCHYWWEGCPNAEKRGCYAIWIARKFVREDNDQGGNAASFLRSHGVKP